jgi:DNA excision repair protein ERCC-3
VGYQPQNPMIVQSDRSVLLEVMNPLFEEARDLLALFAELVKSPEHIHTYQITPLSLWNAAASGMSAAEIVEGLSRYSKFPLPDHLVQDISDYVARYGRIQLVRENGMLVLRSADPYLLTEIWHNRQVRPLLSGILPDGSLQVDAESRGHLKQAMIRIGFPVEDLAGYNEGAPLHLELQTCSDRTGEPFIIRSYQQEAIDVFHRGGSIHGGSGVIVLPCGAGKTVVGIGVLRELQTQALVLTTNITAVRQWIDELLDKTTLTRDLIGEYTGEVKEIRPITVTTYQILTHRESVNDPFLHFRLFNERDWGLIIYDEVHLLPAPVFRVTAEIQARRRLGLTATLVREDHQEEDVFSLIGPKRYDLPWKVLERQGFIATAVCHEIRAPLADEVRLAYAVADDRNKFRVASENPVKYPLVRELVRRHSGDQVLVIGQYLDQLRTIAAELEAPLITGQVPSREREELYGAFKRGEVKVLVVSKVANFAVDLPDANVAIQVSGTFGSRQEEAQRLGRILRPKRDGSPAYFYSLVTRETRDQEFGTKRQLFLTEQGYRYLVSHAEEFFADAVDTR